MNIYFLWPSLSILEYPFRHYIELNKTDFVQRQREKYKQDLSRTMIHTQAPIKALAWKVV